MIGFSFVAVYGTMLQGRRLCLFMIGFGHTHSFILKNNSRANLSNPFFEK